MFTLEVVKAKHGDCLLLHYGLEAYPQYILIDGGPSGVYRRHLKPTLKALKKDDAEPVMLDLVMVSHIDADHIKGVIDMARELANAIEDSSPNRLVEIGALWHNSFAGFNLDDAPAAQTKRQDRTLLPAEANALDLADISEPDIDLVFEEHTKLALAGVKQGIELSVLVDKIKIDVNPNTPDSLVPSKHEFKGDDLTLKVIGPAQAEVDDLREKWQKEVTKLLEKEKKEKMEAAAYLDKSIANLSSLIVVAESGGKRMLLTGDARGDQIIACLREFKLLEEDGKARFDLMKMPHHGSDRNVEVDFFRTVLADHYVISGDGYHGNPELKTFQMLFEARSGEEKDKGFVLHMTYPPEDMHRKYPADDLEELFDDEWAKGTKFRVNYPEEGEHSMKIKLV